MTMHNEQKPAAVPDKAKQAGETRPYALGLGGTVCVDRAHAGSPRKRGERKCVVQLDR
jgi:hypothetical protein